MISEFIITVNDDGKATLEELIRCNACTFYEPMFAWCSFAERVVPSCGYCHCGERKADAEKEKG